jgi:two-component system, NarL family, sensor kinase
MQDVAQVIIVVLFIALIVVFVIGFVFLYQRRQRKNVQEKQLLKSKFEQEILQTQIEIQEQTLKTISQEIHDNIGQALSLVKLNLFTITPVAESNTQNKINSSKEIISKAINDLRDLVRSLHGDKIAETGLREAIFNELRIIENTGQFKTTLLIKGEPYKMEPQHEMILYRIVQEALHNAIKHSKATHFNVQLNYQPGFFSLSVQDDGKGFEAATLHATQTGIGLKSMQNRIGLIGGSFSIRSSQNNGTAIIIELPLK